MSMDVPRSLTWLLQYFLLRMPRQLQSSSSEASVCILTSLPDALAWHLTSASCHSPSLSPSLDRHTAVHRAGKSRCHVAGIRSFPRPSGLMTPNCCVDWWVESYY
ncbi:hypothetical protein B0T11DRAFT_111672 [Plectosphaerella cucumerina]|uniref:Uncharacterized protein n=1 Tax=Plectosphaerella cucumerina TaxID=40658 RepID=A0A8K0X1U0_9PEZI|nr:hypothetical protein B0T11DRAFT_111672 [Plectosphaerella cucumerina]